MDHDKAIKALRAVLLFHDARDWNVNKRLYWLQLTGETEATTRVLCDCVRRALGATEHVVEPGDTLSALAERYTGNSQRWFQLWGENANEIGPDPHCIYPGTVLRLPREWCNENAHKTS